MGESSNPSGKHLGVGTLRAETFTASIDTCMSLSGGRAPIRATLPHPDELPIPRDVQVCKRFTRQMVELADHIGAYATLQMVAAFGGEYLYIPEKQEKSRLTGVIGSDKAAVLSRVYGRERLRIPTGKSALSAARRSGVIAAVRAAKISVYGAARLLRTTSTFVSHLVNHTDEGVGVTSFTLLAPREVRLVEDAIGVAVDELTAAGIADDIIQRVAYGIGALVE